MSDELPVHYRRLREAVTMSLLAQPDQRAAQAVAALLHAGHYDIVSHFTLDEAGEPVPGTLAYGVHVLTADGWVTVVRVDWRLLGLEWADVQDELANTLRQHADGTYPGGEHDQGRPPELN